MRIKSVLLVVMILLCNIVSAEASVIDQSQELCDVAGTIWSECLWAQIFTPSISGQLAFVEVFTDQSISPGIIDYPSFISIVNIVAGVPSESTLGEIYLPHIYDGWNTANFLSENIFLNAGVQYAIMFSNDDPQLENGFTTWGICDEDVYSGGSLWNWNSDDGWNQDAMEPIYDFALMDATFRTYMVPEPSTLLLLGLGAIMLRKKTTEISLQKNSISKFSHHYDNTFCP